MEALTGRGALSCFQTIEDAAHELQQQLNVKLEDVPAQLRTMQERQKALEKELKQLKLKVQAQIMDDKVRVTGKKLDELQAVIAHLKANGPEYPLQFVNLT